MKTIFPLCRPLSRREGAARSLDKPPRYVYPCTSRAGRRYRKWSTPENGASHIIYSFFRADFSLPENIVRIREKEEKADDYL
jgi:hypothetical protein